MQYIRFGYGGVGPAAPKKVVGANGPIHPVSGTCWNLVNGVRLSGSYTIEALYVMAISLFAFATVFGMAYRWRAKAIGSMKLHTQVEIARYQEDPKKAGPGKVREFAAGNGWDLDITAYVPEPEEWLRMMSLTDR